MPRWMQAVAWALCLVLWTSRAAAQEEAPASAVSVSVDLSTLEAAIEAAKKAAAGDDLAAIKRSTEELQRATHAIAELLYKSSAGQPGPGNPGAAAGSGSSVKEGEVVDAEYAETV